MIRSAFITREGMPRPQPVPFSHEHHVYGLGIDCRYCHVSVEVSSFAGLPSTKTCMTCHSQLWTNAEMLEPVRRSWETGRPIAWTRVHDLPDHVYFDHSIHVQKGVGCSSCHGRVDRMPLVWKTESLQMEWCLGCHRDPSPNLRPRERVFDMEWNPPADQQEKGRGLTKTYALPVQRMADCSVCHR
jgi:hypothetical protein